MANVRKCQWVILHRLKNTKPPARSEACGKPGGLLTIRGMGESIYRIWLCKLHWECVRRHVRKLPEPLTPVSNDAS